MPCGYRKRKRKRSSKPKKFKTFGDRKLGKAF